jgi:hypothetical protein
LRSNKRPIGEVGIAKNSGAENRRKDNKHKSESAKQSSDSGHTHDSSPFLGSNSLVTAEFQWAITPVIVARFAQNFLLGYARKSI